MAARRATKDARSRRRERTESPPPNPGRAPRDRHLNKRTKGTQLAHSDSDEDRQEEDSAEDESEEEKEAAHEELQGGSGRNGAIVNLLSLIHKELKTQRKTADVRHKVMTATLAVLLEKNNSIPSSALGSPLVSFTTFQINVDLLFLYKSDFCSCSSQGLS